MRIERILVVDDEPGVLELLRDFLSEKIPCVVCAASCAAARALLAERVFDLVLCDVLLPDGTGGELLREAQAGKSPPPFIMMSGQGTIESATEAMREGAADYLVKPFQNDQLEVAIRRQERWQRLTDENAYLHGEIAQEISGELLGESAPLQAVKQLIAQVAATDATVLILGESGTGKELVARALHRLSLRKDKPFIRLNCAAIPESLLESEMFGHERGAFTGAFSRRSGRFEMANGGTLLLDEISEMPLALQSKLLRVIQEREFERVGGNHTLRVDVRLLATSNRDLEQQIREGSFREDLYYRINVIPLRLPPLRARAQDIEPLLAHFLRHFAEHHGKPLPTVRPETLERLRRAPWPGNVRELQNSVERAVLLARPGVPLDSADFSLASSATAFAAAPTPSSEDLNLENTEKRLIRAALERSGGRRTEAARLLGISLRALHYKIRADPEISPGFSVRHEKSPG